MNELEKGIAHDGLNPRLVEDLGGEGILTAATSSFRPLTEQFQRRLTALDGDERGIFIVLVRPAEVEFSASTRCDFVEYIQSAGSAEAMTIEIRRRETDGALHQYAVGRRSEEYGERTVTWASNNPDKPHSLTVPAAEAFTAEQAHPVYLQWAWDQTIPDGFGLRPLDPGTLPRAEGPG